ncbi:MAG: FtsW/RodA/SpoVE family cell cycle protein, partial [Anaerolineales bacterium]|nr:FtsW/RodA/SpoVE family cell cycle protein [Anaerolineales bacterium]
MLRIGVWRNFDFLLLGSVIIALVFGVTMIRSAIAGNETLTIVVERQMIFGAIGFGILLLVSLIDYRFWSGVIGPMYTVIVLALGVLRIVGGTRFGATRWIETGLISIQPTELAKIVIILALANYFAKTEQQPKNLVWLLKSLAIALGVAILIYIQPNLSNVIVTMVLWLALAWLAGMRLQQFIALGVGVVALPFLLFPFLQPYQQDRIINFLAPDPEASYGATYNVLQALAALGSGGLLGKGYGLGTQTQLRFMKVRHTDFIFSAVGEELGFVGCLFVLLLLGLIIYRCLRAAHLARDTFGALIAYGVAILIFFQASVNIAVNLNLIPVTGVPLPFISYGGSGLVS